MEPLEALALLNNLVSSMNLTRGQHTQAQQAVLAINGALSKEAQSLKEAPKLVTK